MPTARAPLSLRRLFGRAASAGLLLALGFSEIPSAKGSKIERLAVRHLEWQEERAFASSERGKQELTLDRHLTRSVQTLLGRARPVAGAALVIEVETGRVLALAEVGPETGESLLFSPLAPAASVFKLITTATLFERSDVTPRFRVCTKGGMRAIGQEHLSPPSGAGVRCAPFSEALGTSRNAAFAQLAAQKLKPNDLREMAERLGMNRPLLLDVPGDFGTLEVPTELLPFARTATGFENSRLSVFGAAQLALTVASGGYSRSMHLTVEGASAPANVVLGTEDAPSASPRPLLGANVDGDESEGGVPEGSLAETMVAVEDPASPPKEQRVLNPSTVRRLVRAMETTVEYGTAREAFLDEKGHAYLGGVKVAGKTGTLQPEKSGPTASWFVGFAPSQKPKVVVSVLLLNSALWYQKGNTVARDILRAYFAESGADGVSPPL